MWEIPASGRAKIVLHKSVQRKQEIHPRATKLHFFAFNPAIMQSVAFGWFAHDVFRTVQASKPERSKTRQDRT
jgi:hypothetical protein